MVAVLAALLSALTGKPAEAERWADVVDRWQHGHAAGRDDPSVAAWAALLRAILCRAGVEQMHADADEAVRRFAEMGFVTPKPALVQGIARVLSGALDGGDASLQDAVSIGEKIRTPEILATGLSERSLVAMARGEWSRADVLAGQARTRSTVSSGLLTEPGHYAGPGPRPARPVISRIIRHRPRRR